MHELALMGEILEIVSKDATKRGFTIIKEIELTVGEMSQIMPDALKMAFEMFKADEISKLAKDATLIIDIEKALAKCQLCNYEYVPDTKITVCPNCAFLSGCLVSGETFQVKTYIGN